MRKLVLVIFAVAASVGAAASGARQFNPDDSLDELRLKISQAGYNFTVGDTWVYKLGRNAKKRMFATKQAPALPFSPRSSVGVNRLDSVAVEPPVSFDWRNQDGQSYIGDIRNQGPTGTCYAFAACAAAESSYNIANGLCGDTCSDFSESYIAWCLGYLPEYENEFHGGAGSGYEMTELLALTKFGAYHEYDGVAWEDDCPYAVNEIDGGNYLGQIETIQFDAWSRIYPVDYEDTTAYIKKAIQNYGVADAAVYATSAFQAYTGGIYEDGNTIPSTSPYYYQSTNHMVALVGWNDDAEDGSGGYWILRNSWGENWGEDGYMRIRYKSAFVNCNANYLVYSTEGAEVALAVGSEPETGGCATPAGESLVSPHEPIVIHAAPMAAYKFLRWEVSGDAIVANPLSASTTVTLTGDASLTAKFKIENGKAAYLQLETEPAGAGICCPGETVVTAIGEAVAINAMPAEGYVFKAWESGSQNRCAISDANSPDTSVTVAGDSIITAIFEAAQPEIKIGRFKMSIKGGKTGGDQLIISKAEYPGIATTEIESFQIRVDNVTLPRCGEDNGEWKLNGKGSRLTYKSNHNQPKIKAVFDFDRGEWSVSVSNVSLGSGVNPLDGVDITFKINDLPVASANIETAAANINTRLNYVNDRMRTPGI